MRTNRIWAFLFVLILILSAIAVGITKAKSSDNTAMKVVKGYEDIEENISNEPLAHDVIRIDSDSEFASQASSEGWPGDGSVTDPYVIENYNIDADGKANAIYIGNTTVHFRIENCDLHGAQNTTNWTGYPYRSGGGLGLYNATNGVVNNCDIHDNGQQGIFCLESSDNEFVGNDLNNNKFGFHLQQDSYLTISDNRISTGTQGIFLQQSSGQIELENNSVEDFSMGILIQETSGCSVKNNTAISNDVGFYISSYCTVMGNTVKNNSGMGLLLTGGQNTLYHNNVSNNQQGLSLLNESDGNEIYENNMIGNEKGLQIQNATGNQIYHNNINESDRSYDSGSNEYDLDYPSGGNHWAGYDAQDRYRGEQQEQPGMDAIADKNYSLDGGSNRDDYPLTHRYIWWKEVSPSIELDSPTTEKPIKPGVVIYFDIWDGNRNLDSTSPSYSIDGGSTQSFDISYRINTSDWDPGTHTVQVEVEDEMGNTVTEAFDFTLDTQGPDLVIQSPQEGAYLNRSEVQVSWSAVDNDSSIDHYEVRLNNGTWEGVGKATNHTFMGLSRGNHTVSVKAVDDANNTGVKEVEFMVDNLDPSIQITSPFSDKKFNTSSVDIVWEADDSHSGIDHFEMKKDEGGWSDIGEAAEYTVTDLVDGLHTIHIRAVDKAGNQDTDQVSFEVDATPPELSITYPGSYETISNDTVSIEWTASDPESGIERIEISLDNQSWNQLDPDKRSYTYSSLSDGEHTVDLRAVDTVENYRVESVSFSVLTGEKDKTPPELTIEQPADDSYISNSTIELIWTGTDIDSGISHYEIRLDGGSWQDVGGQTNHTYSGLSDGEHTISVRAYDGAGNEKTESVVIEINTGNPDETSPTVKITEPESAASLTGRSVQVNWEGSDDEDGSGIHHYEIRLDGASWHTLGKETSYTFENVTTDEHTVTVRVFDRAGNQGTDQVDFKVSQEDEGGGLTGTLKKNMLLIIVLVVIAVAVIGGLFFFFQKGSEFPASKRPSDEESEEDVEGELTEDDLYRTR